MSEIIKPEDIEQIETIDQKDIAQVETIDPKDIDSIQTPEEISQTEAALRGGVQGLTLGFGDEIIGAGKAAGKTVFGSDEIANILDTYRRERDLERTQMKAAEEAYPKTFMASEIGGGIAPAFFTGGASAIANIGKVGAKELLKQGAKTGATYGAAGGLGYGEADLTKGEVPQAIGEMVVGAGIGGALGGATGVAAPYIGDAISTKSKTIKEWFKDQSPLFLRNIIHAGEQAKSGEKIVGAKIGEDYMKQLKEQTSGLVDDIHKARKEAKDEFQKVLIKDETNKTSDDMINFFDGEKTKLETLLARTVNEDEKKGLLSAINEIDLLKNKFKTKETLELPDTTNKEKAIQALENKRTLMQVSDEQNEGVRKEVSKLIDQYMLKEGVTEPAAIDVYKISKLLKLPSEDAKTLLSDAVKIKYKEKELIPELGVEIPLPKEKKVIAKKYEPGEVQIDEAKGVAYFFDNQGKIHSKSYGEIPIKKEIIEKQNPMYVSTKELYDFKETLQNIANTNNQGLIKSEVGRLTGDVGKELNKLLEKHGLLEDFQKLNQTYASTYNIGNLLKEKDVTSNFPAERNVAANNLIKFFENISRGDGVGQETRVVYNDFLKEFEKTAGKVVSEKFNTEVNKLAKLIELNRSVSLSALQGRGLDLILGGAQAFGVRGGREIGRLSRTLDKGTGNVDKIIKNVVNVLPKTLSSMSEKMNNPRLAQLFKNLAATENDQTRRALLFSAVQNPNTREELLKAFGVKKEEK